MIMASEATDAVKQKRTRNDLRSYMSGKYPDNNYESDDDLDDALYGELEDYDKRNKELSESNEHYKQQENEINELFSSQPSSANFLADMADGKDPIIGLIELYGSDGVNEILNDPKKKEEIAKAHQKYLDDAAEEKRLEQEFTKNIEKTIDDEEAALSSGEITQEEIDKAHEVLKQYYEMVVMGKWTVKDLKGILKGVNYDADVSQAREAGEVMGRNSKIVENKKKRSQGDGMPVFGGSGSMMKKKEGISQDKLGALAKPRKSMWD